MERAAWIAAITGMFSLTAAAGWGLRASPFATSTPPDEQSRAVAVGPNGTGFPLVLIDGYGRSTHLESPPKRIVSAMLATDEILLDLVPPEQLAAVTYLATDPSISNCSQTAKKVPATVGASVEPILAQRPDLVLLARFTPAETLELLRRSGTPTFQLSRYETLDDIRHNVKTLSLLVGEPEKGEALVAEMDRVIEQARQKSLRSGERPRVLYLSPGNFSAGAETIFDELVTTLGGVNVAAELGLKGNGVINTEIAIALDPDVIIFSGGEPGAPGDPSQEILQNPAWQNVRAVRNHRVHVLPSRHLSAVSHHVMKAADELANVLYDQPAKIPAKPESKE